ncbi:MAG: helix-turn-helix transcriptional regulator [Bacteroidales bacterium]
MVNRIQIILKKMNLSPSQLADEIQIQRSGISHILSERNKPSLDFVSKVLERFPELNAEWLIFGKGPMMKIQSEPQKEEKKKIEAEHEIIPAESKPDKFISPPPINVMNDNEKKYNTEIEKIVIFYKDNTFKEYTSK